MSSLYDLFFIFCFPTLSSLQGVNELLGASLSLSTLDGSRLKRYVHHPEEISSLSASIASTGRQTDSWSLSSLQLKPKFLGLGLSVPYIHWFIDYIWPHIHVQPSSSAQIERVQWNKLFYKSSMVKLSTSCSLKLDRYCMFPGYSCWHSAKVFSYPIGKTIIWK